MNEQPLISIIMPAYNAEAWIEEAVQSVRAQSWDHWELLVIDNGSTDQTVNIVNGIDDNRIHLLGEPRKGVSHARNTGLDAAKGVYICFLDADDMLPRESLQSRLKIFEQDSSLKFVDGVVHDYDDGSAIYAPKLKGRIKEELASMNSGCFFGNTWMIKAPISVRFRPELNHCEDLVFYLDQVDEGLFAFTEECVLRYRRQGDSAMSDIDALGKGYQTAWRILDSEGSSIASRFGEKAKSIMYRTYLKKGRPLKAMRYRNRFFS